MIILCAHCGHRCRYSLLSEENPAPIGTVTFCPECGEPNVFAENNALEKPAPELARRLGQSAIMQRCTAMIRARRRAERN
jgi:superfamily II helicase